MIELTRFDGRKFYLNVTHIELVEGTPDTLITLANGKKYIVKDDAHDVAARVTAFYQAAPAASMVPRSTSEFSE